MAGINLDEFDVDEYDLEQEQYARIMDEIAVEDRLIEMMVDWYEQQEANQSERGCESLDEADHNQ
jgi:hypothetical protein